MKLGLLKYGSLKLADLTPVIVGDIARELGINVDVDAPMFTTVTSLLKANDVDGLADLVAKPQVFQKLQDLLTSSKVEEDDNLIICPHCKGFINS